MRIALDFQPAALARTVEAVCRDVRRRGGRALAVGGCVRDALLGQAVNDVDLEVYGIAPADLRSTLEAHGPVDLVGEAFSVLKLRGRAVDVSIPRRESKHGTGHRGFLVQSDPGMTPRDAARRRDFTVNAMAADPLDGELIDPFQGRRDLRKRILRHVSAQFAEDPLRVLRAMRFAARLDFDVAPETVVLCGAMTPDHLARERVFGEWRRLLLEGVRPSRGLDFLRACGWTVHYPELQALIGCPQDPQWHPEGDVWNHTLLCLNAFAAERLNDAWEDLVVGLAVLCHDFGKPAVTCDGNGRLRSPGHATAGAERARAFLGRLTDRNALIDAVLPLVANHMHPEALHRGPATDAAVRRLSARVGRIDRLVRVARADRGGIPGSNDDFPAGRWLLECARRLEIERSRPRPIVMGRHLIELGLAPGPRFGAILSTCYEAQLDGQFRDLSGGLRFARQLPEFAAQAQSVPLPAAEHPKPDARSRKPRRRNGQADET